MSAQTFADFSKQAPKYTSIKHKNLNNYETETGYVCHIAAMYWMFRELGESEDNAHQFIQIISLTTYNEPQKLNR